MKKLESGPTTIATSNSERFDGCLDLKPCDLRCAQGEPSGDHESARAIEQEAEDAGRGLGNGSCELFVPAEGRIGGARGSAPSSIA